MAGKGFFLVVLLLGALYVEIHGQPALDIGENMFMRCHEL